MARIDFAATTTPKAFIVIALTLCVLRLGVQAFAAPAPEAIRPSEWKTASEADRDFLPGSEDVKEPEAEQQAAHNVREAAKKAALPIIPVQPLSEKDKEAVEDGKLILYEFLADWSDPCKAMDKNALSNEQISSIIDKNFVPIRVKDVVHEQGKNPKWVTNLQKRYHVFALPTFVVTDKSGEPRATLIGNCTSLTVERFLVRALSKKS